MRLQIQEVLAEVQSFTDLHLIVEKAKPELSYLGARNITSEEYEGSLSLDSLAVSTMALVRKNFDFSEKDRVICKKIAETIDRIYEDSDLQVENSNWITWLICKIRYLWDRIFDGGYGDRFHWEMGENKFFEYYTRPQYKKVFWSNPDYNKYLYSHSGCPDRWPSPKQST